MTRTLTVPNADGTLTFALTVGDFRGMKSVQIFNAVTGAHVCDYLAETFMCLHDGFQIDFAVPGWTLDWEAVARIQQWLRDDLGVLHPAD